MLSVISAFFTYISLWDFCCLRMLFVTALLDDSYDMVLLWSLVVFTTFVPIEYLLEWDTSIALLECVMSITFIDCEVSSNLFEESEVGCQDWSYIFDLFNNTLFKVYYDLKDDFDLFVLFLDWSDDTLGSKELFTLVSSKPKLVSLSLL